MPATNLTSLNPDQAYRRSEALHVIQLRKAGVRKELKRRGLITTTTVFGFVCPKKGFLHSIKKTSGVWVKTIEDPDIYLAAKLERVVTSTRRFIILIGGRGSGKSIGVVDIRLAAARDDGVKAFFLREFQSSIKNSVHSLIKEEVLRLEFPEFSALDRSISCDDDEVFQFAGLARNTDSIKSAHGFGNYSVEESQFITEESLTALLPTARKKPNKGLPSQLDEVIDDHGVSMTFVANPGSTEDPFSKRFINPYIDSLLRDGFYEDDLHLIVMMNYVDNPWYHESGLEELRLWDKKHRSGAHYDHVWMGGFNDSVEDALIMSEWFDACIDAHIKLGWKPRGALIASHDPSDTGPDDKGYALRHGTVFLDVQEKLDGDVNVGGHWAAELALKAHADYFTWDCDGLGVGLAEQLSKDFEGKKTTLVMFKGSETPDNPKAIYRPVMGADIENEKTIEDSIKNKRAQYYFELRERCYKTYRAVVFREHYDPDEMISFSSDIKLISKVRSELCRMPVKPSRTGLIALYTKDEMKRIFKVASPNLGDSIMMNMRYIPRKAKGEKINYAGWSSL